MDQILPAPEPPAPVDAATIAIRHRAQFLFAKALAESGRIKSFDEMIALCQGLIERAEFEKAVALIPKGPLDQPLNEIWFDKAYHRIHLDRVA